MQERHNIGHVCFELRILKESVSVCVCVCKYVCSFMCAHICTYMWRPEINIGCRSLGALQIIYLFIYFGPGVSSLSP